MCAVAFGFGIAILATGEGAQAAPNISTLVGTGVAGYSDSQINNPLGMAMGPDGALYFCDYGNQRIRRFDLKTKRLTTVAGNGNAAYQGDGGPAVAASLHAPHEVRFDSKGDLYIADRDNHVIRKVDMKTGIISTVAGTGVAGFSGDGGPGIKAQLRQPHSILFDRDGSMLICDVGNQRIRRLHFDTGLIETYAGTGEANPTPDGAPVLGTPLTGPRAMELTPNGDLYVVLRDADMIFRIDARTQTLHHVAGTGEMGFRGDNGDALNARFGGEHTTGAPAQAPGPKGLAYAPGNLLYVADTESHAIRLIDLNTRVITTVVGTGERGDGPEPTPGQCKLARPHAVLFDHGVLYIADSDSNRIRVLR